LPTSIETNPYIDLPKHPSEIKSSKDSTTKLPPLESDSSEDKEDNQVMKQNL